MLIEFIKMGVSKKKGGKKKQEAPAFDIWDAKDEATGEDRAIVRPQPLRTSENWTIDNEMTFHDRQAPRRRAVEVVKPNKRAAVAAPHPGQSFNPQVDEHQDALKKAVTKLEKQKASHQRFVRWMSLGRTAGDEDVSKFGGGLQHDSVRSKTTGVEDDDDEEAEEVDEETGGTRKASPYGSGAQKKAGPAQPPKKKKKKLTQRQAERRTRHHIRHPDRLIAEEEIDHIKDLQREVNEENAKKMERLARRKLAQMEGQQTKKIGRHIHHPLPLEVQPSKDLVGSLRHVKSGVIHPVQDRLKSLEERNLVPARVRHTFNKRKVLKSKGEVMIRREPFGVMPDTLDRH